MNQPRAFATIEKCRISDSADLSVFFDLGNQPRDYADAIVGVVKLYAESPLVCVAGVTGANLKKRIEAIMSTRTTLGLNFAKKAALALAGLAFVALPVGIGRISAQTPAVPQLASPVPVPPPLVAQVASPLPQGGRGRGGTVTPGAVPAPAVAPGRQDSRDYIRSIYGEPDHEPVHNVEQVFVFEADALVPLTISETSIATPAASATPTRHTARR